MIENTPFWGHFHQILTVLTPPGGPPKGGPDGGQKPSQNAYDRGRDCRPPPQTGLLTPKIGGFDPSDPPRGGSGGQKPPFWGVKIQSGAAGEGVEYPPFLGDRFLAPKNLLDL